MGDNLGWVLVPVLAIWVVAFSSWKYRNWRASTFLVATTACILVLGLLPESVSVPARVIVWLGSLLFVLLLGDRWLVADRPGIAFAEAYVGVAARLKALREHTLEVDLAETLHEWDRSISDLERLTAPSPRWDWVKTESLRELRRRRDWMIHPFSVPDEVLTEADAQWAAIEERFKRELAITRGFWAKFPHLG